MQTRGRPEIVSRSLLLNQLLFNFNRSVREKRLLLMLLSGHEGSGRSTLLSDFALRTLDSDPRPQVIALRFQEGQISLFTPAPFARTKQVIEKADRAASMGSKATGWVDPTTGAVVRGALKAGSMAITWHQKKASDSVGYGDPVQLSRAIQSHAVKRPVVCILDDIDDPGGHPFAEFLPHMVLSLRRSVFLVCSIEHREGSTRVENPGIDAAVSLLGPRAVRADLAPLSRQDIAAVARGAPEALQGQLLELSYGHLRTAVELWADARRYKLVRRTPFGRWVGAIEPDRVLMEADLAIGNLLTRVATQDTNRVQTSMLAKRMLRFGSLEGRTFTAEVAALAAGEDPDTAIDALDLVTQYCTPLLRDAEPLDAAGSSLEKAWRYYFLSAAGWRACRELERSSAALTADRRKVLKSLKVVFGDPLSGSVPPAIGSLMAALHDELDETDVARAIRTAIKPRLNYELELLLAEFILHSHNPNWDAAVCAWACDVLGRVTFAIPLTYLQEVGPPPGYQEMVLLRFKMAQRFRFAEHYVMAGLKVFGMLEEDPSSTVDQRRAFLRQLADAVPHINGYAIVSASHDLALLCRRIGDDAAWQALSSLFLDVARRYDARDKARSIALIRSGELHLYGRGSDDFLQRVGKLGFSRTDLTHDIWLAIIGGNFAAARSAIRSLPPVQDEGTNQVLAVEVSILEFLADMLKGNLSTSGRAERISEILFSDALGGLDVFKLSRGFVTAPPGVHALMIGNAQDPGTPQHLAAMLAVEFWGIYQEVERALELPQSGFIPPEISPLD